MFARTIRRAIALLSACAVFLLAGLDSHARAPGSSVVLGAPPGEERFAVPPQAWADLNGLVFLIAFDVDGAPGAVNVEYARRFRSLAAHARLRAAARQFGSETYSLLLRITQELSRPESVGLGARLAPQSAPMARGTQQLAELEYALAAAVSQYRRRGFAESEWVTLGPPLGDAQRALDLVQGQWRALVSDVASLQRLLGSEDELDHEVAQNTWTKVTAAASAFAAHMPAHARVLRGEHYYDQCPVKEGVSYALVNDFLDKEGMALALVGSELRMARRPARSSPAFAWRFRKVGQGWWKLENLAHGGALALDVASHGEHHVARLAPVKNVSGQLWRCLPSRSSGWSRLSNAFQGELRSLDTYRDTLRGFMANTEHRSGQYWRFVQLPP